MSPAELARGVEMPIGDRRYRVSLAVVGADEGADAQVAVSDVTDWRRAEEENARVARLLEDIADSMPLLLFVKRADDLRFEFWNRTLAAFSGIDPREIVGTTGQTFFPSDHLDLYQSKDREVLDTRTLVATDEPITTPQGTRWIHTQKLALPGGAHAHEHLLGISEDITDHRRAESERHRLYDEVSTALTRRDRVLSAVAHDLGNPIALVSLTAAVLSKRRGESDEGVARQASRLATAARQMDELVADVRADTLLREGRLALDARPHDVDSLLREVLEMHAPLAEARGIRLRSEIAPGLPPVWCDLRYVARVFANLLGNAFKFATGCDVLVRAEPAESHVRFCVTDGGPGIGVEEQARVFEPYWQAEGARSQGMGLGLFIAKQIVEASGGTIGVDSQIGRGTTFFFTLPHSR